jgi:hypothetical protein
MTRKGKLGAPAAGAASAKLAALTAASLKDGYDREHGGVFESGAPGHAPGTGEGMRGDRCRCNRRRISAACFRDQILGRARGFLPLDQYECGRSTAARVPGAPQEPAGLVERLTGPFACPTNIPCFHLHLATAAGASTKKVGHASQHQLGDKITPAASAALLNIVVAMLHFWLGQQQQ